jgi:hypothetical protein
MSVTDFAMPVLLAAASPKARTRVLEFFGASIRNDNTRKEYIPLSGRPQQGRSPAVVS